MKTAHTEPVAYSKAEQLSQRLHNGLCAAVTASAAGYLRGGGVNLTRDEHANARLRGRASGKALW
ncbi:hypothetical protein SAMN06309944_0699 [Micrococcales bacterium KH10]|nr:hypothetical protein SAMN06309944_0699 [Micrococcales bacterium KH10]